MEFYCRVKTTHTEIWISNLTREGIYYVLYLTRNHDGTGWFGVRHCFEEGSVDTVETWAEDIDREEVWDAISEI